MIKSTALCACVSAFVTVTGFQTAASAQCGKASWYHEGARTANGERYRPDGISAAHRSLPFGTKVLVRHQRTGRSVVVRINDRGPFIRGRIIDLSRGAKRVLGMDGLAPVCLTVLGRGERYAANEPSRRKRVAARTRTQSRTAYRTTQTSADTRRLNRSAKRAQPRTEARLYRPSRKPGEESAGSFKIAGWPRSNDANF